LATIQARAPSPALAPPPGNPRFPLFDALRGLAVLSVVVFHVAGVTGSLSERVVGDAAAVMGSQGPIVFFAISGFLLYRPFASTQRTHGATPGAARYWRKRALRILPAYWVALTLLAFFPGIAGVFSGDWWRYYFFLQLYSHETLGRGIPVAWTLCVEVSFYLVLPLWAWALRRRSLRRTGLAWMRGELLALGAVAVAGGVVQLEAARLKLSYLVADSLAGQCTWFALGMGLAVTSVALDSRVMLRLPRLARHPNLCWAGAFAAFCGLAALVPRGGLFGIIGALTTRQPFGEALGKLALSAVVCLLLLAPAAFDDGKSGMPRRLLLWAPLVWCGVVSYGIYLWHLTLSELLALPLDPAHFSAGGFGLVNKIHHATTLILLALVIAVTGAIATLSYRFIELPFLRRKER
jgi:peptidoglycan/LPS O-acetylase OafA/YrhL